MQAFLNCIKHKTPQKIADWENETQLFIDQFGGLGITNSTGIDDFSAR